MKHRFWVWLLGRNPRESGVLERLWLSDAAMWFAFVGFPLLWESRGWLLALVLAFALGRWPGVVLPLVAALLAGCLSGAAVLRLARKGAC